MSMPVLEVGIGADLTPFEKAIGELRQEIRQLGTSIGAAGQQATGGYTRAMGQAGKTTDDLSGFIRTQRAESRQQNYLFREGAGIIGAITFSMLALSNATGSNSKEMQRLNSVLVSGYSTFQAADFAMAALGISTGGVATAFKLIVGVGAAVLTFLGSAKKETADLTRETLALNAALRNTDAVLANRAARTKGLSDKRIQSELDLRLRTIAMFEQDLAGIATLLATASDEDKKKLEGSEAIIKSRVNTEWDLVKALMEERKRREEIRDNARGDNVPLEARLAFEQMINDEIVRRMQLEIQDNMRNPEPVGDIFTWQNPIPKKPFGGETITGDSAETLALKSITTGRLAVDALIRNKQEEMKIWKQSHEFEMSLLDGLKFGVVAAFDEMLMVHRQAKDTWDAIWIAMQNTVISSLVNIGAQLLQNAVIGQLATAAATAATVASMAAIAASAAPAAYAVSVATFGGAALAGTAAYLTGLATIQAASLIPGLAGGGLAYGPMLAMVGDNPNAASDPEVIAPFSKLQTLMEPQKHRIEIVGRIRNRDLYLVYNGYLSNLNRIDA